MSARRAVMIVALVVFAALEITPATSRAAAVTSVPVPASIDATGRTDVTAALVSFFAAVAPGSTVTFPSGSTYRIDGVLRLNGLHNVTIEGNGAQLIAPTDGRGVIPPAPRYRAHWPRLRTHVDIRRADSVVVRHLSVQGPNAGGRFETALEGQAGFTIAASTHVTIEQSSVSDTFGDGVYVAGKSSDVTVRDDIFDTIGRQGVAVVNASNVLVAGNRFRGIARSAVDVEPASPQWSVTGLHVQYNDIGAYGNFALAAGGAGAGVNDLWFQGNHVTGGNGIAVFAGGPLRVRNGLHIIDNRSDVDGKAVPGSGRTGVIQLARTVGVEIVGNRQRIAGGVPAVTLDGVCNVVMRDNAFPGASSEQQIVAPCGAPPSGPKKSGSGAKKSGGGAKTPGSTKASGATPSARGRAARGSTDNTWLVVGVIAGAIALAVLGGIVWNRRRPDGAREPDAQNYDQPDESGRGVVR